MNIVIAITLIVTYMVVMCVINRQIPESISQMASILPRGGALLWTLVITVTSVLWFFSFSTNPEDTNITISFIVFLAMLVMAMCPLDKQNSKETRISHTIAAYVALVMSQVLVAVNKPLLLLLWVIYLVVAGLYFIPKRKKTFKFWAEITCFVTDFALAFLL